MLGNRLNITENNNIEGLYSIGFHASFNSAILRQLSRYDKKVFDRIGCLMYYDGVYSSKFVLCLSWWFLTIFILLSHLV